MNTDAELLGEFADRGSETAFAELVRRKVDLVYAAALRQTGGDAHLAQDVTQGVFLALACRAASLKRHAVLTGWLYTSTRFVAAKAVRTQARWQRREQEATIMTTLPQDAEPAWDELRPVIDEAMHELDERDRDALLLRFFEGRSLGEVGAAIGLAENSARMRVERALEKLRGRLASRGITSTAVALTGALAHQPLIAAPAGLAAQAVDGAIAGATALGAGGVGTTMGLMNLMSTTKVFIASAAVCAALGVGVFLGAKYRGNTAPTFAGAGSAVQSVAALRAENERLKSEVARLRIAGESQPNLREPAARQGSTPARELPGALDHLRLLTNLQNRKLVEPSLTFLSRNGELASAFIELFALTPAEQRDLRRAIDTARDRVAELERANATVDRNEKGEVVITLNSFPQEGGVAYDQMMKGFSETLGPERNTAFLALGAQQVERALGRFGAPQRTITITPVRDGSGNPRYSVREDHKLPQESGNSTSEFRNVDEMAQSLGVTARLLPADLAGKQ